MDIDGSCHCGKVTYTAKLNPRNVIICHCADCQLLSGTAFRTVAPAREENFHIEGETRTYVRPADSGNERTNVFCPNCGTHIYGTSTGDGPKIIGIRAGTARQRDQLVPQKQIWCRSGLGWLETLPAMERVEQQ